MHRYSIQKSCKRQHISSRMFAQCPSLIFWWSTLESPPRKEKHFGIGPRFLPSSYLAHSPTTARQLPVFLPPLNYNHSMNSTHCIENPIYVFLFWELRGLSPNFQSHVSVSDLHIPKIGRHISFSRINRGNI
jgi:hypothetical protein